MRYRNLFKITRIFFNIIKASLYSLGVVMLLMLIISFTTLPFWGIYRLATSHSDFDFTPDYIVVMGGSGIPGKSGLIRTYYAAQAAKQFPEAKIIIATPTSKAHIDSTGFKMAQEIRLRQIEQTILFENKGTNTRSQALYISQMLNPQEDKLLIVSSPEHIYRAASSFEKLGFSKVGGLPAFGKSIKVSLKFDAKRIGGKAFVPDVGDNKQLRYQFWNHWQYQIQLLREYVAILYYKLNDWV